MKLQKDEEERKKPRGSQPTALLHFPRGVAGSELRVKEVRGSWWEEVGKGQSGVRMKGKKG